MSKEPKPKQEKSSAFIAMNYFFWLLGTLVVSQIFSVFIFAGLSGILPRITGAILNGLFLLVLWFFIGWLYGARRIRRFYFFRDRRETLNYFTLFTVILWCVVLALNWSQMSEEAEKAGVRTSVLVPGLIFGLVIWSAVSYGLAMKLLPAASVEETKVAQPSA